MLEQLSYVVFSVLHILFHGKSDSKSFFSEIYLVINNIIE